MRPLRPGMDATSFLSISSVLLPVYLTYPQSFLVIFTLAVSLRGLALPFYIYFLSTLPPWIRAARGRAAVRKLYYIQVYICVGFVRRVYDGWRY